MNRRNVIVVAAITVIALASVPLLYAGVRSHREGVGFGPFGRLQKVREKLDLSDQQVDALKAIALELREQNAPYREQLRGGFTTIAKTLVADPSNVAAAQDLLDQQNTAERALKTNVLNAASKALSVLTPEQRAKLAQMIEERQARIR